MLKEKVNDLYETISNDLKILKYFNEEDNLFHNRLVYSAIGYWVLNVLRDKYDENDNQVSKMHVTITTKEVLNSYLKIDESLKIYFDDVDAFVNVIALTYINLGYVSSGKYSFKLMKHKQRIAINNAESLLIRNYIDNPKLIGLGVIRNRRNTDILLEDFFVIKIDAFDYFNNLLLYLKFNDFNSEFGKIEVYNCNQKRWDFYTERIVKSCAHCVLRIDGGLEYAITRVVNNLIQIAKLPPLYTKQDNSEFFHHEEWRVILGCCASNGSNAVVKISDYYSGAKKYSFKGYILPDNEMAFIRCISWPSNHACYTGKNNIDGYIVPNEYCETMDKILDRFNILKENS